MNRYTIALCSCLVPLLSGCGDELKPLDRIEEPRVLAARVEVDGDATRTSALPGELVHVRWLVATPSGDALSGFALSTCSSMPQNRGASRCREPAFASQSADANSDRPSFDFAVPPPLDAQSQPLLTINGSLCPGGSGSFVEQAATCSDQALPVTLDLELGRAEYENHNPEFLPDSIGIDGSTWTSSPNVDGPCAGAGLVEISASSGKHRITIAMPDSAREPLTPETTADLSREALRIAHFTSAGELVSAFSEIDSKASKSQVEVEWKPPASASAEGELVRFWFVVRDGRSGSDFSERALCLRP